MLTLVRRNGNTQLVDTHKTVHFTTLTDTEDVKRCKAWARCNNQIMLPVEMHENRKEK